MTRTISLRFDAIGGTRAGLGHAGGHSLIADRPEGRAGGMGLGFNGGELLAASLGGCFWNDLHYAAEAMGQIVEVRSVDVALVLDGTPARVTGATISARLNGVQARAVFDRACVESTIANSISGAIRIDFAFEEGE